MDEKPGPSAQTNRNTPGYIDTDAEAPIRFRFNSENGCSVSACKYV